MDKSYQQVYTTGTQSIVSDAQTISSGSLQQQQQLISQSPVTTPTSTVLLQTQQPPPTAYNTSYPYHQRGPPPPQQIFQAHSGRECQEASMEDVTRSASYKLDYSETSMDTNSTGDHHKDVGGMQISSATTAGTVASTGK